MKEAEEINPFQGKLTLQKEKRLMEHRDISESLLQVNTRTSSKI